MRDVASRPFGDEVIEKLLPVGAHPNGKDDLLSRADRQHGTSSVNSGIEIIVTQGMMRFCSGTRHSSMFNRQEMKDFGNICLHVPISDSLAEAQARTTAPSL